MTELELSHGWRLRCQSGIEVSGDMQRSARIDTSVAQMHWIPPNLIFDGDVDGDRHLHTIMCSSGRRYSVTYPGQIHVLVDYKVEIFNRNRGTIEISDENKTITVNRIY